MTVRIPGLLTLSILLSIPLAGCATSPRLDATEARAATAVGAPAERVVVAPLNVAVRAPAELAGKGEPVWHELLGYFQSRDRQVAVLSSISAERLWLEATVDLDVSDRASALKIAESRFAQGLAEHRDYDLLVVPSLVLRPARMHGQLASWDGVEREVPQGWDVVRTGISEITHPASIAWVSGLRGKVGAASLHVTVLRPDGTLVYQGIGGLDLIQEARRDESWDGKWTFELREQPFADSENLREGVERAFERELREPDTSG